MSFCIAFSNFMIIFHNTGTQAYYITECSSPLVSDWMTIQYNWSILWDWAFTSFVSWNAFGGGMQHWNNFFYFENNFFGRNNCSKWTCSNTAWVYFIVIYSWPKPYVVFFLLFRILFGLWGFYTEYGKLL